MKYFVLIAAFIIVVSSTKDLTPEELAERQKIRKECSASTQVDKKLVDQISQGIYENDDKLKEYILCIQLANGFQDHQGNIHPEILKPRWSGHIEEKIIDRIIENCAAKKETPKETAFQFAKCASDEKKN